MADKRALPIGAASMEADSNMRVGTATVMAAAATVVTNAVSVIRVMAE